MLRKIIISYRTQSYTFRDYAQFVCNNSTVNIEFPYVFQFQQPNEFFTGYSATVQSLSSLIPSKIFHL